MKCWIVVSLLGTGCAVGYGVGHKSHSVGAGDKSSNLTYENSAAKVGGFYQELRIIDSTGVLLAALVNAGRQHLAREEAMERAKYQRPDRDGYVRVEYSWVPMPILAGLITDLRFRTGLGDPDLEVPAGTEVMGADTSFWELDLRPEFYTFRPFKSLPLVSSLFLGMTASNVSTSNIDVDRELDLFALDLTAGVSSSYVITPNILATGRVAVGYLSPLLSSLVGGSMFHPSGELEVGWRPVTSSKVGVMVSGTAAVAREWILSPRTMTTTRFGLNVAFSFGNQTPKAARERAEETPAPVAAPAESVCKDAGSVCQLVEQNAPPEVKAPFQACGRASIEADRTGNAGTQPATCQQSAQAIAAYYTANEATLTPEMKKLVDVAAAGTFSLAALGYRVTKGQTSAEECAMTEQMFSHITRSVPEQASQVNAAVEACRQKWTCSPAGDGQLQCTAR